MPLGNHRPGSAGFALRVPAPQKQPTPPESRRILPFCSAETLFFDAIDWMLSPVAVIVKPHEPDFLYIRPAAAGSTRRYNVGMCEQCAKLQSDVEYRQRAHERAVALTERIPTDGPSSLKSRPTSKDNALILPKHLPSFRRRGKNLAKAQKGRTPE